MISGFPPVYKWDWLFDIENRRPSHLTEWQVSTHLSISKTIKVQLLCKYGGRIELQVKKTWSSEFGEGQPVIK